MTFEIFCIMLAVVERSSTGCYKDVACNVIIVIILDRFYSTVFVVFCFVFVMIVCTILQFKVVDGTTLGVTLTGLNGNSDYNLTVSAATEAGEGPASVQNFKTSPGPCKEYPLMAVEYIELK